MKCEVRGGGAPVPSPERLVVSYLAFRSAMSIPFTASDTLLSALLKPSGKEANLPSREVTEDCSALLHVNIPPGKEPSLSLLCG